MAGLIERLSDRGWEIGLRTFETRVSTARGESDALLRTLATVQLHDQLPDAPFAGTDDEAEADILVAFPEAAARLGGDWDTVLDINFEGATDGT
ncbi:MAG: hypothetical protein ABEN55_20145 [Bradymonadaceae bacterium]